MTALGVVAVPLRCEGPDRSEGEGVSAGSDDSVFDVEDVEDVEDSVSVGSAHAMPGVWATAAPRPSAAASSPTLPM